MYLEKVLGSKTKIKLIKTMLENEELTETELSKKANASNSETNRQIKDLIETRLIKMKKIGRTNQYTINKKHFLYNTLKKLFKNTSEHYEKIARKLVNEIKESIDTAILIGSTANKTAEHGSDIDLILITEKNLDLTQKTNKIFDEDGVQVQVIKITKNQYLERVGKDSFITKAHSKGRELYGKKPRKFSSME